MPEVTLDESLNAKCKEQALSHLKGQNVDKAYVVVTEDSDKAVTACLAQCKARLLLLSKYLEKVGVAFVTDPDQGSVAVFDLQSGQGVLPSPVVIYPVEKAKRRPDSIPWE